MEKKLELGSGDIHVWFAEPDAADSPDIIERYESLLAEDELESYQHLRTAIHQREYLVSHALLREVLSQYHEETPDFWSFERNKYGKPEVAGSYDDIHFNIAHASGLVACVVSRAGDVGIDVERHTNGRAMLSVADHYFSPQELAYLESVSEQEKDACFYRFWTLKEAYIKAVGQGLSTPLVDFSFNISSLNDISIEGSHGDAEQDWQFWLLQPMADHTSAVAVRGKDCTLKAFSSTPLIEFNELDSPLLLSA